eukprot:gnl/MRDRNA2_/MRDRNA2_73512_c0_seq1.p1 gnl/MRDRNA2_/MRDRNA2_73512_c0~~gnl/MRDRNA2_/MRDRNA2_73512_c0_seq1.p1  ORF type:complete len:184 (+),score=32.30 gnl/MRDRNA2_/MRDRNA2_73512_c0_seq1:112-663(+)
MVSQALIALSLLVVPAASVASVAVQVFEGETAGCEVLDTIYTGVDLIPGTTCKKVVSESVHKGNGTVGLKYIGTRDTLKFKVHATCEDIHGMTVVMEASEAESAKILAGECGQVIAYIGEDEGIHPDFNVDMYMKITAPTDSGVPTSTAPNVTDRLAVADQAESINMVMPMVSVVLARMLLAY